MSNLIIDTFELNWSFLLQQAFTQVISDGHTELVWTLSKSFYLYFLGVGTNISLVCFKLSLKCIATEVIDWLRVVIA